MKGSGTSEDYCSNHPHSLPSSVNSRLRMISTKASHSSTTDDSFLNSNNSSGSQQQENVSSNTHSNGSNTNSLTRILAKKDKSNNNSNKNSLINSTNSGARNNINGNSSGDVTPSMSYTKRFQESNSEMSLSRPSIILEMDDSWDISLQDIHAQHHHHPHHQRQQQGESIFELKKDHHSSHNLHNSIINKQSSSIVLSQDNKNFSNSEQQQHFFFATTNNNQYIAPNTLTLQYSPVQNMALAASFQENNNTKSSWFGTFNRHNNNNKKQQQQQQETDKQQQTLNESCTGQTLRKLNSQTNESTGLKGNRTNSNFPENVSNNNLTEQKSYDEKMAQQENNLEEAEEEHIRTFLQITTLRFKDPIMEYQYWVQVKDSSSSTMGLSLLITAMYTVFVYGYIMLLSKDKGLVNYTTINSICFGLSILCVSSIWVGFKLPNKYVLVAKFLIAVAFMGLSVLICIRHGLYPYALSTYQTGFFQLLLMTCVSIFDIFGFLQCLILQIAFLLIYLFESFVLSREFATSLSTSSEFATKDAAICGVGLFAVSLFLATYNYEKEKQSRITHLKNDPIFQSSGEDALSRRINKKFDQVLIDFESPLEKSIHIATMLLEDPQFDKRYTKYLSWLIELLQSPDIMSPDFTSPLNRRQVDQDQEAWILSNLYRLNRPTLQLMKSNSSMYTPPTTSTNAIGAASGSRLNIKSISVHSTKHRSSIIVSSLGNNDSVNDLAQSTHVIHLQHAPRLSFSAPSGVTLQQPSLHHRLSISATTGSTSGATSAVQSSRKIMETRPLEPLTDNNDKITTQTEEDDHEEEDTEEKPNNGIQTQSQQTNNANATLNLPNGTITTNGNNNKTTPSSSNALSGAGTTDSSNANVASSIAIVNTKRIFSEANSLSFPQASLEDNSGVSSHQHLLKQSIGSRVISADEMKNNSMILDDVASSNNQSSGVVAPQPPTGRRWSTPHAHAFVRKLTQEKKTVNIRKPTGEALDAANTVLAILTEESQERGQGGYDNNYSLIEENDHEQETAEAATLPIHDTFASTNKDSIKIQTTIFDYTVTNRSLSASTSPVTKSIMELNTHIAMVNLLERTCHWNWDVFELNSLSQGHPLLALGHYLFVRHDLYNKYSINKTQFLKFLRLIEAGYRAENPYHNAMHATDVLHAVNWLKDRCTLNVVPNDLEVLALYFAAMVHDYDHPGLNNNYLISRADKKALLYNDRSVLENYHVSSAFNLMLSPENNCNFLSNLTKEEYKTFREMSIQLVLSTDLQAHHFALMTQFKNKVTLMKSFDPITNAEDRMLLWKILIKCSDVSNPSKKFHLYEKWTYRILDEFFHQGDLEKEHGMPVSPFFDRDTTMIFSSQLGFIDFICSPLFDALDSFVEIKCIVNTLVENRAHWAKMKEEHQLKVQQEKEEEARRQAHEVAINISQPNAS